MIPGELLAEPGELELNAGRPTITLVVANTGDRPIQVGSHYHFAETNAALGFDREVFGFAGLSLFVGAFVIYHTFSILVAQRQRELALLRAVGAARRSKPPP